MASSPRRNLLFALALVAVTAVVFLNRTGAFDEDAPVEDAPVEAAEPVEVIAEPAPASPSQSDEAATPPPLLGLSFQDYATRYEAVSDSFRARDQLVEQVVGKRVAWAGYVRNVSKQTNAFYVSLTPQDGYGPVSALATFPHDFEETLYALRQGDFVRFEGTISRASMSVGLDGTAIAKAAPPME